MAGMKKTFHSAQGNKIKAISDNDLMVIAQPDSTALEGYRTVNANLSTINDVIFKAIQNQGGAGLFHIVPGGGILGRGTPTDPFVVDLEWFKKRFTLSQYANVTQIGNIRESVLPIVKGTGFVVTFNKQILVYLAGTNAVFQPQSFNLNTFVSNPANKRLHMYFSIVAGKVKLSISTIPRTERYDSTYIGTIYTTTYGIDRIVAIPFMRLGNYRLSATQMGSAIPVNNGLPMEEAYPDWGGYGSIGGVHAGIDPTQFRNTYLNNSDGQVHWNHEQEEMTITFGGQFFIKDLALAIEHLGNYYQTLASGGVRGATGYLNGHVIWKGKGTSAAVVLRNGLLVEGWNWVKMEWGSLRIKGPFLK